MSWSVKITDEKGDAGEGSWNVCEGCVHAIYREKLGGIPCYIPKVAGTIASLLTSVDTTADGIQVTGDAELKCNNFVASSPVTETTN